MRIFLDATRDSPPSFRSRVAPRATAKRNQFSLVHRDSDYLDAQPQWVQLVALAFAEVVVDVAAFFVVEADEQFLLVLRQLDFQRLAGRQTVLQVRTLGLDE